MYIILMFFPEEGKSRADMSAWYPYGTYANRGVANELAMQIRDERKCEVWVRNTEDME